MRKLFILLASLLVAVFVVCIFRTPVLRSFATFLIREDSLQLSDAIFVLSGAGYDRGNKAAGIFRNGFAPKIICTGENHILEFKSFNIDTLESDGTLANLKRQQIPDSAIIKVSKGTSTREESQVILDYCLKNHLKKIILVSSKLHTRRINSVFKEKFEDAGIKLCVVGCPSSSFDEMLWWQTEEGTIAINNEWMKTVYYWWKY